MLYDRIDIITPVKVEGKSFVTIRVPYEPDYETFCKEARHIIESIDPGDNPYKVENEMAETGNFNVVHLSAVPKLYFTSMSFTLHEIGNPCTHPLSVMGKAVERENGKIIMPYSIYVTTHSLTVNTSRNCLTKYSKNQPRLIIHNRESITRSTH